MPMRIWSAGCSSGQEPYSMAMVLAETIANLTPQKVEIWASDLSLEMLKLPPAPIYTTRDVQGVSPARLRRFFLLGRGPREGSFRVVPEIRDLVKFRHLDLRNPSWAVPNDFPDHFLPQRVDLFRRRRADDSAQPPGAAPAPGRLAGHGQRRDPARSTTARCASTPRRCFRRRGDAAMARRERPKTAQPRSTQNRSRSWSSMTARVVRQRLKSIIESDPRFRVVLAADPYEAVAMLSKSVPGVIVLDVEMPRMDGLTFPAQADAPAPDAGRALHGPGGAGRHGARDGGDRSDRQA